MALTASLHVLPCHQMLRADRDNYVDEEDDDRHKNMVDNSANIALFSGTRDEL